MSVTARHIDPPPPWGEAEEDEEEGEDDVMHAIECTCCRGWISHRVPCFGYQDDGDGWFLPLVNCPGCRSTVVREVPTIYVTAAGIGRPARSRVVERRAA